MPDIPADVDRRIDALFALDPTVFTAQRGGEVKELKAVGRAEDAARIQALRRPTVAAWALNQLVRAHPDEVGELLAVSDGLRAAQEHALAGDATEFRRLLERRRELERTLVEAAVAVVVESPSNPAAARDEIAGAISAAAADPAIGAALRAGRLERAPVPPTGFDLMAGIELPPVPRKPAKPRSAPVDELAAKRAAAEAAREQARAAAARAERVEAAAGRRQRAKAAAEAARKEVRRLETELARARRVADRADAELEQAREAERGTRD